MNNIDRLIAGMEDVLRNPSELPNYKAMILLRDKIVEEGEHYFPSTDGGKTIPNITLCAGRCVAAMKIDVNNDEDVEKIAEFMFHGFKLMAMMTYDLCGCYHFETLLQACRQLEIRC